MGLENLLYYILNLIVEGHKWQYQNATCTNKPPRFYFTALQWVALGLALMFIITKPSGLNNEIVDFLLSSLSIMTGFFLALVVVVYEKHMGMEFHANDEDGRVKEYKLWNYLRQFSVLTSYAILISIVVITILIGSLLFGHETHFSDYTLATSIKDVDLLLTIRLIVIVIVRFLLIYFLLDFFILTVYAITSLFQFVNVKMNDKQPANPLENVKVQTDKQTLKSKYPRLSYVAMAIMWISIGGMIVYELEPISKVIKKVLSMLANLF